MWDEIQSGLRRWRAGGTRFALATVVGTRRSTPRPAGTTMAVSENGEVLGSLSGGCVEGDVYELAMRVLETGRPELARYGVTDAHAFEVGLTCGGELDVFVEPVDDEHFAEIDLVLDHLDRGDPVSLATWISDDERRGAHVVVTSGPAPTAEERSVFVQSFAPPPRMIVFGAVDFAVAMARIGTFLGFRVTVCDARPTFATVDRFPGADEVVVDWPHRYLAGQDIDPTTVLCVLTHDPKFDVPLLRVALETEAGYIGVMGSRLANADLTRRLYEAGVSEAQVSRLRSPIGLDVGARTPQETAVSIAAEIIATANGRSGLPLRDVRSPIHGLFLAPSDELAGK